jgi:60 kDa SS-A/Ro ribonucleoprotein
MSFSRNKTWNTVPIIVDALNAGFLAAFKHVEPSNKRTMLALVVSGSMANPAMGLDLSCAQVSAALAMSIAKVEPYYSTMAFAREFKELAISPSMGLTEVMTKTHGITFGNTDCSLPMVWARKNKINVDTFVVLTDNETWAGNIHPHVALRNYRSNMGIDARLVVVGMASNGFTIADPNDSGMLDVVGADSNLPKLVSEFSAGRI